MTVEFEAERVADGDHELATFEALGIAKRRRRERHRLVDPDQGKIGVGIVADQAGVEILTVRGRHLNARGSAGGTGAGNVAVGEDEAIRRDDDAGTGAAAGLGRPGSAGTASRTTAGPTRSTTSITARE